MKKHLVVFVGLCLAMSMAAETVNMSINAAAGGFTKEQGDKFVGNAGVELKDETNFRRDLIIDFNIKTLSFVPDTVLLNVFVNSIDKADSIALLAYGKNAKIGSLVFSDARALPALLCDSLVTCKDACEGKFVQFDVRAIMDSLTTDSVLGFRIQMHNLTTNKPLLKSQSYKGTSGQRPYLYFAKGTTTAVQNVAAKQQIVNAQYGQIRLNNVAEGQVVTVYNMQGQLVANEVVKGGSFRAEVPANYYIVNIK